MSERPTPRTTAELWRIRTNPNVLFSDVLERMADFARDLESELIVVTDLARELRDALEQAREDSVELAGQYHWKRGAGTRNNRDMAELDLRIVSADQLLVKAKEAGL